MMRTTVALILILAVHLIGHGQESSKGNWSSAEKRKAVDELYSARENFESFLSSDQTDALIVCLIEKLEMQFENFSTVDGDSKYIEELTLSCLQTIGYLDASGKVITDSLNTNGNWSDAEVAQLREELERTRSTMEKVIDSTKVDSLFDCVIERLQERYVSFSELLEAPDSEASNITSGCVLDLGLIEEEVDPFQDDKSKPDPTSSKGSWSQKDLAALDNELNELRPDLRKQYGFEKTEDVLQCIRKNFEASFENYVEINNQPEVYKDILDTCYELLKQ